VSVVGAKVELELESTSTSVSIAVRLLVELLAGIGAGMELKRLELALDEAIRNAYEHGNLGISSEEKSILAAADAFEDELRRREQVAVSKGKRIRIAAELTEAEFVCRIADDGDGFDWQTHLQSLKAGQNDPTALSGRGVSLISRLFDVVTYNDRGNEMTVSKKIPMTFNLSK
jgi:anti-sigma regulatory factor (Ser/Thr protein kinase)